MSSLYLMVTITDRNQQRRFLTFYQGYGAEAVLSALGRGTASSEVLDYMGLEASEKAALFSVVTGEVWKEIKLGLQQKMMIDIPGTGIAFVIPLSSIAGKRQLAFLTGSQVFVKGEESALKNTKYELLIAIANQGYTEMIMNAARKVGAGGGTVIHAKGTGMDGSEKFLGVSLATEKEMVFIVVKSENKNAVMEAVSREAGLETKAKAVLFSLPVTSTAGLRLAELPPDLEAGE
ncbi:MAG: P-II family nitrogen regulator [Eubacteriales bacterium]|nr:P-II family nitrogen regulator [Eubacteriales bacterium]